MRRGSAFIDIKTASGTISSISSGAGGACATANCVRAVCQSIAPSVVCEAFIDIHASPVLSVSGVAWERARRAIEASSTVDATGQVAASMCSESTFVFISAAS